MSIIERGMPFVLSGLSPASASSALITGAILPGLGRYDDFLIDAIIIGGTGGTVDLYIQRRVLANVWVEWAHFPQVAAAATKYYSIPTQQPTPAITNVGKFDDAGTGTAVIAANTFVGGHPGDAIRLYVTAGASTSAAATQTVYVTPIRRIT